MMSIVADHSFGLDEHGIRMYSAAFWANAFNIQVAKFGTITFFLMAGFLLGDKFADYSPAQYLGRRFKSTFKPWIIWSLLFLVAIMAKTAVMNIRIYHEPFNFWADLFHTLKVVYLDSNYWFIINFLICIGLLLLFKRQLYKWQLGAGLLACTLFYSVNIYYEWIPPGHTTALFGFVFFLWLGAQLHKNWEVVERKIRTTPLWVYIALVVLTLCLTFAESCTLYNLKSADPFNTLRITNIFYSLAGFALLVKIRNFNVSFFKPRETTYGIYLIHYILVFNMLPEILIHLNLDSPGDMRFWQLALYQYSRFLVVYLTTVFIVKGINRTRFKWIIGGNTAPAKS